MSTTINRKTRDFVDLDLSFARTSSNDVALKTDENAIKASLKHLILTINYERPFHPEIGCQVNNLLFEPMDAVLAAIMEQSIYDVVAKFEPRVKLLQVKVAHNEDQNEVRVSIVFQIRNNERPITMVTILNRVR